MRETKRDREREAERLGCNSVFEPIRFINNRVILILTASEMIHLSLGDE